MNAISDHSKELGSWERAISMRPCMERTLLEKVPDVGPFDFITAGAEDGKLEEMLGRESRRANRACQAGKRGLH